MKKFETGQPRLGGAGFVTQEDLDDLAALPDHRIIEPQGDKPPALAVAEPPSTADRMRDLWHDIQLLATNEQFRTMRAVIAAAGIEPGVHVGSMQTTDPVTVAEWIMGQWAQAIDERRDLGEIRRVSSTWFKRLHGRHYGMYAYEPQNPQNPGKQRKVDMDTIVITERLKRMLDILEAAHPDRRSEHLVGFLDWLNERGVTLAWLDTETMTTLVPFPQSHADVVSAYVKATP